MSRIAILCIVVFAMIFGCTLSGFTNDREDLVGYYSFDGDLLDTSGSGLDGNGDSISFGAGQFGQALSLNPSRPEVIIPIALDGKRSDFTIEMWIALDNDPGVQNGSPFSLEAIERDPVTTLPFYSFLELQPSGTRLELQQVQDYNTAFLFLSNRFTLPFGTPNQQGDMNHYAIVSDDTRLITYFNGVPITTGGLLPHNFAEGSIFLGVDRFERFEDDADLARFDGRIDELRIWADARTQEEIVAFMDTPFTEVALPTATPTPTPRPTPTPPPPATEFEFAPLTSMFEYHQDGYEHTFDFVPETLDLYRPGRVPEAFSEYTIGHASAAFPVPMIKTDEGGYITLGTDREERPTILEVKSDGSLHPIASIQEFTFQSGIRGIWGTSLLQDNLRILNVVPMSPNEIALLMDMTAFYGARGDRTYESLNIQFTVTMEGPFQLVDVEEFHLHQ